MRIKINDWNDIHKPFFLTLQPGYTVLVGPNGAGKTTLLLQLQEYAKKKDILLWKYSNLTDGGRSARNDYGFHGNMELLATSMCSSEGEEISIHFGQAVKRLGKACKEAKEQGKPLFILLDSLDSGASIDRVRNLLDLFDFALDDMKGNVYIIAAVNQYEMTKGPKKIDASEEKRKPSRCINVRTGKEVTFESYEQYADFICSYFEKYPDLNKN